MPRPMPYYVKPTMDWKSPWDDKDYPKKTDKRKRKTKGGKRTTNGKRKTTCNKTRKSRR